MENKFKTESNRPITVDIVGMDEVFNTAIAMERVICKYERFMEDVILSCVMPEQEHFMLEDEEMEGTMIKDAHDALHKLLNNHRKMLGWFKKNNIDPETITGENTKVKS